MFLGDEEAATGSPSAASTLLARYTPPSYARDMLMTMPMPHFSHRQRLALGRRLALASPAVSTFWPRFPPHAAAASIRQLRPSRDDKPALPRRGSSAHELALPEATRRRQTLPGWLPPLFYASSMQHYSRHCVVCISLSTRPRRACEALPSPPTQGSADTASRLPIAKTRRASAACRSAVASPPPMNHGRMPSGGASMMAGMAGDSARLFRYTGKAIFVTDGLPGRWRGRCWRHCGGVTPSALIPRSLPVGSPCRRHIVDAGRELAAALDSSRSFGVDEPIHVMASRVYRRASIRARALLLIGAIGPITPTTRAMRRQPPFHDCSRRGLPSYSRHCRRRRSGVSLSFRRCRRDWLFRLHVR